MKERTTWFQCALQLHIFRWASQLHTCCLMDWTTIKKRVEREKKKSRNFHWPCEENREKVSSLLLVDFMHQEKSKWKWKFLLSFVDWQMHIEKNAHFRTSAFRVHASRGKVDQNLGNGWKDRELNKKSVEWKLSLTEEALLLMMTMMMMKSASIMQELNLKEKKWVCTSHISLCATKICARLNVCARGAREEVSVWDEVSGKMRRELTNPEIPVLMPVDKVVLTWRFCFIIL